MGKIAFLFAGQGAQYPGMGKDLYENSSRVKDLYEMAESLRPGTKEQCFFSDSDTLKMTENTQPCLFLTDYACAIALEERGVFADEVAGFSLGEIAALPYAGIMGEEDAFSLVCERGNLMAECNKKYPGTMLAVLRADQEMLEALCEEYKVYPVNYNCPGQVSVAGKVERIEQFKERLTAEKIRFIPLAVSGSFHTPYMNHVSIGLLNYLEEISIQSPRIPIYANTTSKPYLEEKALINHLISRQVSHSVQWEKILRRMHANGCDIFIECGPGQTLSGFVKKTLKDVDIYNVNDMESLERTCESLAVYA